MRPIRRRAPCVLLSLSASLLGLSPALAAGTNSFTASLNNDWSNGQNWTTGKAPTASDTTLIDRMPQLWLGAGPGSAGALFIGLTRSAGLYAETALSAREITLGSGAGGAGSIVAVGTAARLSVQGPVAIGQNGVGEIDLYRAASLSALSMVLGSGATGQGTLVVSGQSSATIAGTLVAGGAGSGRIDANTAASLKAGALVLGAEASGKGSASISGGDTTVAVGALTIGQRGSGALDLSTAASLSANSLVLGAETGGSGQMGLSGGGTRLGVSGGLTIGLSGRGVASLYTGATATAGRVTLGQSAGSSGSLTVGGGGTALAIAGDMTVGDAGRGSFALQDGAVARAGRVIFGNQAKAEGNGLLSGDGSVLSATQAVEIGRDGAGALTVTGGATLSAPSIDLAVHAGSSGMLAIGARHGEITRGAGAVNASAIRFGQGAGTLVFNIGGPTYRLGAAISGNGTILADAGSVELTGDSSAFTGSTRLTGGTLAVNGALGGTVSVGGYGTLSGSGTVGSLSVAGGGTVAPAGSGTGTLRVKGDLTFGRGGHFQATVAPAANRADLLAVSGHTAIGAGAVLDVVQQSAVTLDRQDVILQSGRGISGSFDTVTSNYAFVTPSISRDANTLFLKLHRNGTRFQSLATDGDARTVAEVGDALDPANPLYRQLVSLSASQAQTTFGDLAGTIHASPSLLAFDVGRFARGAAVERAALGGLGDPSPAATPSALTAYVATEEPDAAKAFGDILRQEKQRGPVGWARAYGGYSTRAEEGGDRIGSTGGLLFGWDTAIGDESRLGLLGGIGMGHVRESARLSSADSRDYTLGLYGGTQAGPFSLRFGTTYVHQDIDSARTARFNGVSEDLSASYRADAVQAYGEIAHDIHFDQLTVEPFANLAVTWQRTEGFSEAGGTAALSVSAAESTQAETLIGLRAAQGFDLLGQPARLRGMIGWNHAFEAQGEGPLFSFAGSTAFSLSGAETAADSLALEAGLDLMADEGRLNLGLTYGGNFAAGAQSHLVKLTLSRQF